MDTNRIRYFLSFAKTGSITKAAELHRISAPAFSKAIKVFEAEVGQTLTLPQGRGLILTDAALILVPQLEEIIRKIESIKGSHHLGTKSLPSTFKIATFEVFSTYFMETVLSHFKNYECSILELIPGKMEQSVASHQVDIALTYLPIPHPELDFLKIQEIEMGIFGQNKILGEINYSELIFVAPVAPIEGSPNKVRGLDGWPDDAFPRAIKYHVQMLETALGICRRGLAVAYIPKFIAELHNKIVLPEFKLKEIPLPSKFPKTKTFVYLVKRKSDIETVEAKKIAAMVRKLCSVK